LNEQERPQTPLHVRRLPFWAGADALRSLTFLAVHLDRLRTRDLAWWQLNQAVPSVVRGLAVQLGSGLLFGLAFGLSAGLLRGRPLGLVIGLGFGLGFGLWGWPSGGIDGGIAVTATLGVMVGLLLGLIGWSPAALVVGLGWIIGHWLKYGARIGLPAGLTVGLGTGLAARLETGIAGGLFLGLLFGFLAGVATWMVFRGGRTARGPSRIQLTWRGKVKPFFARFAAGSAAGFLAMILIALVGLAGLAVSVIVGIASGLTAGLTVWLDVPAGPTRMTTPLTALKLDRMAAIVSALIIGLMFGIAGWIMVILAVRLSDVTAFGAADGTPFAIASGIAFGTVVLATRSWAGLIGTRAWLALTGRLPWSLIRFLAEADRRGVLHQVGGVYRFRDTRLQDQLVATAIGNHLGGG
jgi:hypothetical protein